MVNVMNQTKWIIIVFQSLGHYLGLQIGHEVQNNSLEVAEVIFDVRISSNCTQQKVIQSVNCLHTKNTSENQRAQRKQPCELC